MPPSARRAPPCLPFPSSHTSLSSSQMIYFKPHGVESIRMMRHMRDSGYLAMLSASDRQRLLLFFITLRITASTQEAIACLFESRRPQLAEQIGARLLRAGLTRHIPHIQVGVRLLRFSLSTMYWRRAISGLANPYLRALSVFGLGALPLSQEGRRPPRARGRAPHPRRGAALAVGARGRAQGGGAAAARRLAHAHDARGGRAARVPHRRPPLPLGRCAALRRRRAGGAAARRDDVEDADPRRRRPHRPPRAPPLILYMTYEPTASNAASAASPSPRSPR